MLNLSDKQMIDLLSCRERLNALRNKCQPYPGEYITEDIRPIFRPRPIDKEIDQLKCGFIHIQKVINTHIDAAKKAAADRKERQNDYKPF